MIKNEVDIMKVKIDSAIEQSLRTASGYLKWMALAVAIGILLSGIIFVQSGEVAVVMRFGKLVGNTPAEQIRQPGLHLNLPFIIDKVIRVPVKKVQEVKIDSLYTKGFIDNITNSGYALTGDNNVVLLKSVLKYKITDPIKYVIGVENPELSLKEMATAALTREIAAMAVDDVLTKRKMELASQALRETQIKADQIGLGVQLIALEFTDLQPPYEVKDAFDLVTSTYVQKETMIQEAKKYQEKMIPEAVAKRNTLIQTANSYKVGRIAKAKSDVAQFYGVIAEYKKNPGMVRERLYCEKVENIMKKVAKKVLVPKGEGGENVILP
jgi:membrane protease subunit HflK